MHEHGDLLTVEGSRCGPLIMQPQQCADGQEQQNYRQREPGRNDQRPGAMLGIAAGQHALSGILIQPGIGKVQQDHAGQHRPQAKGRGKAGGGVDQRQLARPVRRMAQRFDSLARGHRQVAPQEPGHHQRRPDIEHHLHQVAPDHRIEPAHEGKDQAEDQQDQHGDQHVPRRDIEEQDHRDGDGSQVQPRPAGEDPADQVHPCRRPPGRRVKPRFQQLVNRGHPGGIESRHQPMPDQPDRHQRREDPADIGKVAAIGEVRHTQERRRRLDRGQHRDRHQPGRRMVPGQEIVLRLHSSPRGQPPGCGQQRDVKPQHGPVGRSEGAIHASPLRAGV